MRASFFVVLFGVFISIFAHANGTTCSAILGQNESKAKKVDPAKESRRKAFSVIPKFNAYFEAINDRILERKPLVDLAEVALIAEEHLLLMGPPGNAKSQFADLILGNMTTAADTKKSYFRIQMTPETTMSETHGPMDIPKLTTTGKYERILSEGMLFSRNVFIDEIFDARSNAQRNILGMLAEKAHAQGPHIFKGDIETVFGATNKYISEVYEKSGDDGPKAVLDRFAFIAFVPATFEKTSSYVTLIQRAKKNHKDIPNLTFEEIENLRDLVQQVEIPQTVAKALALLSYRMKAETEALELASIKSYKEKIKNGEEPSIPYRATKFHSPRTLGKAAAILKAVVVRDWAHKKGKRKLEATIQDLAQLEKFFTLNGPADSFVKSEIARTSNPHERTQLMSILQEREIFQRHFNKIVEEMDGISVKYALSDLSTTVGMAKTVEEKRAATRIVLSSLAKVIMDKKDDSLQSELDGAEIGRDFVVQYLEGLLKSIISEAEFAHVKTKIIAEIEKEKKAAIEAAEAARRKEIEMQLAAEREAARKAHEEKMRLEEMEKKRKALVASFSDPSKFEIKSANYLLDPRNQTKITSDPTSGKVAVYHINQDTLNIYDSKEPTGRNSLQWASLLGGEKVDNIKAIHFLNEHTLILVPNTATAFHKVDLKTNNVETFPLGQRTLAVGVDKKEQRIFAFDNQTMKMKYFMADGRLKQEAFTFEPVGGNFTEADMKNKLNYEPKYIQMSPTGKYALIYEWNYQAAYKLDFDRKTIKPVEFETGNRGNNNGLDSNILNAYDTQVTVADLSGSEPVIRKQINNDTNRGYAQYGITAVDGTSLMIQTTYDRSKGFNLINGQDGSTIVEGIFNTKGMVSGSIHSISDGHFAMFVYNGTRWEIRFVKRKE